MRTIKSILSLVSLVLFLLLFLPVIFGGFVFGLIWRAILGGWRLADKI